MGSRRAAAAVAGALMVLAACSPDQTSDPDAAGQATLSASTRSASPSPSQTSSPSTPPSSRTDASAAPQESRWEPTKRERRRAKALVGELSLRELAGQVIVAEYDGKGAPAALVERLHLGGVIVMSDNISSTAQLRRSNRSLRAAVRESGRRWPVFIGVDQEGGVVERVQGTATRFPSFMSAGAARQARLTRRAAAASAAELRNLGFTVVFAPDADVTSGPDDPTIGSRSASSRPRLVSRQVRAAVEGYLSAGVLPVAKHFPGHGSVPADSHVELPVQTKSLRALRRTDLVPFREGVEAGMPSVMVGHIDVRAVDPRTPSTVSRPVVTGLLRRDLGYDGLVVTDAMNMAAVAESYTSGQGAVRALAAGVDVVLMPPDPTAARDGIVRAVRQGRLPRARLEQAAARQVATLLHMRASDAGVAPRRPGTSRRASYELSAGAATVVSGPCRGRLVGPSVQASGPADVVRRFNAAAARAGLRTGSGTSVALVGYGGSGRSADVVVTTDTPYPLARSTAPVKIAMFGDTPGAMRALVDVLLGEARAPGTLPVPVPGVSRRGC